MNIGFKKNKIGDVVYLTVPSFEGTGIIKHAFTTRYGGTSKGVYGSMNMGFNRGDDDRKVKENYKIICDAINVDYKSLVLSKQAHTDNIKVLEESDRGIGIVKSGFDEDIDGFICDVRGLPSVTFYADCVPLLFLDKKKGIYASVHSGWKGTVKRIGEKALRKLISDFGCNPSDILFAIGPSVHKCHFEVSADVRDIFAAEFGDTYIEAAGEGKFLVDLQGINKSMVVGNGVLDKNITLSNECTCCNPNMYFSQRMHGDNRGSLCSIMELI